MFRSSTFLSGARASRGDTVLSEIEIDENMEKETNFGPNETIIEQETWLQLIMCQCETN